MTPPDCTVCDCSNAEWKRRRHNSETCQNFTPHPMQPVAGDKSKTPHWECPRHDRG